MAEALKKKPVERKTEEWQQVGSKLVLAVVNNSSRGIFEDLQKDCGELTNVDRKELNRIIGRLSAVGNRGDLEKVFKELFGKDYEALGKPLFDIIEVNFSSYSEFASIFKLSGVESIKPDALDSFDLGKELSSNYVKLAIKVEDYISTASNIDLNVAIPKLNILGREQDAANFFIRMHFGMSRDEFERNFTRYGAEGGNETELLESFVNKTL
ncbi:hypothetical protein KJ780_04455, partial [Candidatus Micrarchaeota archaeon]|nr:hypothetical protein [Candidatus Micrarchaeota archaeon]